MKAKTEILTAERIVKVVGEGAGQVLALKGVNVALRTGELTLLMGPSGSGRRPGFLRLSSSHAVADA